MNTSIRTFGLLLPLAFGLARAETTPAVLALGASGWRDHPVELTASSGDPVMIDVLVPDGLDLASLWLDLRQVAGRVMLPLTEARPLAEARVGSSPDAYGITTLRVEMPVVKRPTEVVIRFGTGAGVKRILGITRVMVYPEIDWEPLGRRLKANEARLFVFGPDLAFRKFLREKHVPYADLGEKLSSFSSERSLVIGSMSAEEWTDRKDALASGEGRIVVFVPDLTELPGVYTTTGPGGAVITKVTLPVPASLGRDRRGEETLLHLFEQHFPPASGKTLQTLP